MRPIHSLGLLAVAAMLVMASGCCKPKPEKPFTINYCPASAEDLAKIRQVAFITLASELDDESVAADTSRAVMEAVASRRLFQVDLIDKTDKTLGDIGGPVPLTLAQMSTIRRTLRCDAILYGRLTVFQPYPRMQMGLRLRLVDLRQGKLVWGVDQIWDTTQQGTQGRIQKYYASRQAYGQFQPLDWHIATISPQSLEQFVAYEIGETLPRCGTPEPASLNQKLAPVVEFIEEQ